MDLDGAAVVCTDGGDLEEDAGLDGADHAGGEEGEEEEDEEDEENDDGDGADEAFVIENGRPCVAWARVLAS